MTRKRIRFWLGTAITVAIMAMAFVALSRILQEVTFADVATAMRAIDVWRFATAAALTALCYLSLSMYDWIALRTIGWDLGWPRAIVGSIAAYALSHNLGMAAITASVARWRIYGRNGVPMMDIAKIVLIAGVTFWLGVLLVMGACLIAIPDMLSMHGFHLDYWMQAGMGLVLIYLDGLYLLHVWRGNRTIGIGRASLPLPGMRDALIQNATGIVEMLLTGAIIWILIPSLGPEAYTTVLIAYVTAFVLVLITHAPGGAGVLEATILVMLPGIAKAEVLSALIGFRLIFHIIPLGIAIVILVVDGRKIRIPLPSLKDGAAL